MALELVATLIGKSAHRDGGYVLTFNVQNTQLSVRVTEKQGSEFANTVNTLQVGAVVKTIHQQNLVQYPLVIGKVVNPPDAPKAKVGPVPTQAELAKKKAELAAANVPPKVVTPKI